MHENAAIAFEHEQASSERKVGAEAARVIHGATGNDETHEYEASPESLEARTVGSEHKFINEEESWHPLHA